MAVDLARTLQRDSKMIETLQEELSDNTDLLQESKVQEPSRTPKLEHSLFNEKKTRNQLQELVTKEEPKNINSVHVSVMDIRPEDKGQQVTSVN